METIIYCKSVIYLVAGTTGRVDQSDLGIQRCCEIMGLISSSQLNVVGYRGI